MGTREEILNIIEKNSRIDVHELSVLLGAEEIVVANELKALEDEGVICGYHTMVDCTREAIGSGTGRITIDKKITNSIGKRFAS